jgi:hypothetical protein
MEISKNIVLLTRWVQLVFNDNFSSVRVIFEKNRPSTSLRMTEHGKFH